MNRKWIQWLGLTGVVERFSVFAAVGFNAVLGLYLFGGFRNEHTTKGI